MLGPAQRERGVDGRSLHLVFDILAWATALATMAFVRRLWFPAHPVARPMRLGYIAAVLFGAGAGAWLLGTANLWLSGIHQAGRSVEGALIGAIAAIEIYKKVHGVAARTGAAYALPLALGIAVGRIGCLLSGLDDNTHGIATGADWGWDFGDGILRHPVQLYESLAMAGFALVYAVGMTQGSAFWRANGFYLAVLFYGAQRFIWEFLKPYEAAIAGLTLFQIISLLLITYAAERIWTNRQATA